MSAGGGGGPDPDPPDRGWGPDHGDSDDPLDRLLDEYSAQAAAEAAASASRAESRAARGRPAPAAARRDAALAAPLPADNKGFALLSKMGYRPGQGLGRRADGAAEPIPLRLKSGRAGLGVEEAARQRKRDAEARAAEEAAKRRRKAESMQHGFKGAAADAYALRKLRRHVAQAEAACASLDERAGVTDNPLLASHAAGEGSDAQAGGAEAGGERSSGGGGGGGGSSRRSGGEEDAGAGAGAGADAYDPFDIGEDDAPLGGGCCSVPGPPAPAPPTAPPPAAGEPLGVGEPQARLEALVSYLRARHRFCVFCGAVFDDEADMAANCPGPAEEDHE